MSTIHRHAPLSQWWYAVAAAVAVSLLVVLIAAVHETPSGAADTPTQPIAHGTPYHGPMFREVCFAMRPGASIELAGHGCRVGTP